MPSSSGEGKAETLKWIESNLDSIKTVLDVGAGEGTYAKLLRNLDLKTDALEVWLPYVGKFKLLSLYKSVFIEDARKWTNWNYDLVILGDILEHMTKEEAVQVWEAVSKEAKYAIISIPIVHYPQGHEHGNPYEEHIKDDWSTQEVLDTFKSIVRHDAYNTVGVFYAKFD